MQPLSSQTKVKITLKPMAFSRFLQFKIAKSNTLLQSLINEITTNEITSVEVNENDTVIVFDTIPESDKVKKVSIEEEDWKSEWRKETGLNIANVDDFLEILSELHTSTKRFLVSPEETIMAKPPKEISASEMGQLYQKSAELIENCKLTTDDEHIGIRIPD